MKRTLKISLTASKLLHHQQPENNSFHASDLKTSNDSKQSNVEETGFEHLNSIKLVQATIRMGAIMYTEL
jgi:hypothetical protein